MNYLTVQETAELLKVHTNTIYKMCRSGLLPAVKLGKDWRINSEKLDRFLEKETGANAMAKGHSVEFLAPGHVLGIFRNQTEFTDFERTFFLSAPAGTYRLLKGCWWQDPDDFRQDLEDSGLPVAKMEGNGDLVVIDLSETCDRLGPVAAARVWYKEASQSVALGYQGLIGSGSPSFTCCSTHEGLIQFESAMHRMLKGFPVTALCSYILEPGSLQGLPELMDLIENHDRFFMYSAGKKLDAELIRDRQAP